MLNTTQTCRSANCDKDEDKACCRVKSIVNIKKKPCPYIRQGFENLRKIPRYLF
jgi:hypothetical protein